MRYPPGPFLACAFSLLIAARSGAEETPPDFAAGRAFLQKHCLECHSGDKPKAELSLDSYRDSTSLVRDRKSWDRVVAAIRGGEMPPDDHPQPSADETDAFLKAVQELFRRADLHAKPDPGRVTMRRLNRREYKNTIRDLVGVDFDPTEDFPADDVGHGFDNIGDVLTLSPILMERYLSAAESIAARAIVPNPPPPIQRHLSTRYSEPASANVPMEGNYRVLSTDGKSGVETGPIHTPYQWQADGEYIFRAKVYAAPQDPPLQAVILVNGSALPDPSKPDELVKIAGTLPGPARVLATIAVKASKPEDAQIVEVRLPPLNGRERMIVGVMKPADGQPSGKLYVEYLALEGPLDMRPASHRQLLSATGNKPTAEKTREVLTRLLRRAYRRPATSTEIERVATLVDGAVSRGESWEAAIQTALQAILCSPKFLFRPELDDRPQSPDAQPLDDYQVAARLSYFLWSTMPDDELFALAEKGQLKAQLDAQVQRMLHDPKSQALVNSFATQWLQIQRIESFSPDAKLFPQFNADLRKAMVSETTLFVQSVVSEDNSILTLLDADYTFLNEPLARHYGIADTHGNWVNQKIERPGGQPLRGPEFKRVSLQGRSRGGLLTHASVLAVTSNPTRTSPVKRGRWVLEQLLGAPPPPPPPNVPELPQDEKSVATGSLRERLETHRKNPSCANCHAKMDPIGFALENYDAVGAFRDKDGAFAIDTAGEFADGRKVNGPDDLKAILLEKKEDFCRCLTEKLLTYALGRGLEYYDRRAVDQIVTAVANDDYRFSSLVVQIVRSDPFLNRRGTRD